MTSKVYVRRNSETIALDDATEEISTVIPSSEGSELCLNLAKLRE